MKIWRDGDALMALCPKCERRTECVFERRAVDLDDPAVRVDRVLVAVCRECDGIAMIPEQSTPRIRAALRQKTEVVNVRLPGQLLDILELVVDRWAPGSRSGNATAIRLLLDKFVQDSEFTSRVKHNVTDPLADGPANSELSVRIPSHLLEATDEIARIVGIDTRTDVFKGILVTAKKDLLDGENSDFVKAMGFALRAVA